MWTDEQTLKAVQAYARLITGLILLLLFAYMIL